MLQWYHSWKEESINASDFIVFLFWEFAATTLTSSNPALSNPCLSASRPDPPPAKRLRFPEGSDSGYQFLAGSIFPASPKVCTFLDIHYCTLARLPRSVNITFTKKLHGTQFIVMVALLRWSGTKLAVAVRYVWVKWVVSPWIQSRSEWDSWG